MNPQGHQALLWVSNFEAANTEIEALGGRVLQRLSEHVLVAHLPVAESARLEHAVIDGPDVAAGMAEINELDELVAAAWRSRPTEQNIDDTASVEGLAWDTPGFEAPG